jgi:phosphoserine phosphatase
VRVEGVHPRLHATNPERDLASREQLGQHWLTHHHLAALRVSAERPAKDHVPLFVDMDGVLVHTDVTVEALFRLIRQRPRAVWRVLAWVSKGTAYLKHQVARATTVDVAALPYNERSLDLLRKERAGGRRVILASAADREIVRKVADHLGLFDDVLASDGERDLTGGAKLEAIRRYTDGGPFDYAGNHVEDLTVFAAARRAIVVNPEPPLRFMARREPKVALVIDGGLQTVSAYLAALRPRSWPLNLLVLLPVLIDPARLEPMTWVHLALAMAAFGLCGSATSILGELLNLAERRALPPGLRGPIADGRVSADRAAPMILVLALAGLVLGLLTSWQLAALLLLFLAVSTAWSMDAWPGRRSRAMIALVLIGIRILGGVLALDRG